ncbi:MAG: type VI secretion system tube protein Hcp [Candidatus Thiodiazotropha sp.]|jgi:type VI secretion system secreted protein Hcp
MAVDIYMKVADIPGEATEKTHENWIKLLGVKNGLIQEVTEDIWKGEGNAGRPEFSTFTAFKPIDTATPNLFVKCAKGEKINNVEVHICESGQSEVLLKYTMDNCFITELNMDGESRSQDKPIETVSFAFSKITYKYKNEPHRSWSPRTYEA